MTESNCSFIAVLEEIVGAGWQMPDLRQQYVCLESVRPVEDRELQAFTIS